MQTSVNVFSQRHLRVAFLWVKQMKPKNQTAGSQSDVVTAGTSEAQAETQANTQAQAVEVLAVDEHAGKPGSYVFDPATGKRSKAE